MGGVKSLVFELLDQGMSQIEAEMAIAHYNIQAEKEAQQALEETRCEEI